MNNASNPQQVNNQGSIGIVGLKGSGYWAAHYLFTNNYADNSAFNGKRLVVFDDKPDLKNVSDLKSVSPVLDVYELNNVEKILEQQILIVSPGVPLTHPSLVAARNANVRIIGDIDLFAYMKSIDAASPKFKNAKILGITGANGKTTVTNLTTHILKALNINAISAGNIGIPVMSTIVDPADVYVLELSSFQLDTTNNLKLDGAVILNVTQDHLDRYPDFQSYVKSKQHIYDLATHIVCNYGDPTTHPMQTHPKFESQVSFSVDHNTEYAYLSDERKIAIPYTERGRTLTQTFSVKDFALSGIHNYENILAAIALVHIIVGCSKEINEQIISAVREFKGLPHRYETVFTSVNNVTFINDSKATNVGSVISALRSTELKANANLYLLLGGISKEQDFTLLREAVFNPQIKVICYGRDAELVSVCSPEAKVFPNASLEEVINYIAPALKKNDVVLLSPGCSSFDQFKGFEDRGQQFAEIVKKYSPPSRIKKTYTKIVNYVGNAMHRLMYLDFSPTRSNRHEAIAFYDRYLVSLVISLFTLGIITVFSSSVYLSVKQIDAVFNFRQGILMLLGLFAFGVTLLIPTSMWKTYLFPLVGITLLSLIAVLVVGLDIKGGQRWLRIFGFTFQPAELAKLTTLIYLAHYTASEANNVKLSIRSYLSYMIYYAVLVILLVKQPDMGTIIMLGVISVVIIALVITKGVKDILMYILPVTSVIVASLWYVVHTTPYLLNRVLGFAFPYDDPYGKSYQLINSLSAFSNGGMSGGGR